MASLTNDEYEKRKRFCKEMEILSRSELEELYRILRRENGEFSENSNGIFFDVGTLPASVFEALCKFVEFCKSNAKDLEERNKIINEMVIKPES
jgi:hypothetical protein